MAATPVSTPESAKPTYRRRSLDPGSPGYQYAQTLLLLHLPNSQRTFLRIDSVQALQNDKALHQWQQDTQEMTTRDAWFYPFPEDDVETVTKCGFQGMDKQPMRVGLYFEEHPLPEEQGPVLKMVLCKVGVGRSIYRGEGDMENITRCPAGYQSVYVPSDPEEGTTAEQEDYGPAVFTDTYMVYDSKLIVPTHVISYHLEASRAAIADGNLLGWVNERCQATFGFTESSFAHYFINLAASSESVTALATRLRDQADVPPALADAFARELYERVVLNGQGGAPLGASLNHEVDDEQLMESMLLLGLSEPGGASGRPPLPPGAHELEEAVGRISACMNEIEELGAGLKGMCNVSEMAASEFDQQVFERSAVFKAELVTYLKEYMLTLQVAEERQQEITRAINDCFNVKEFMEQQKDCVTKVSMITQWKNLTGLRNDLKRRLQLLTGLKGTSLVWLTPTADDQEIKELARQKAQKDRVLKLLAERLQQVPEHELTSEDYELIEICG